MPGSLADYLAKNYLNADPTTERPKKKRKKTKPAPTDDASNGLIIADDDPPDLRNMTTNIGQDDEYSPAIDTSAKSAEFRRSKKSGWKTVGGPTDTEQAAADAILASAAAERTAREDGEDEEAPLIEEQDDDEEGGPKMESGARGGLQTAAQTAAMVKAQEKKKKAEMAKYQDPAFADATSQETIYRDASGRIINVAMKRAEARRAEEEKIKKEAAEREAAMGDVQRQQRASRKQELEEIKSMPVARTIDDEDLNDDLRSKERWNDPAAGFLTQKAKPGASVTGRPLYRGSFQPNRYGIRPGHRWDGVDRANGFEKEWFASRNKRDRMEALEYQWQMDE